MKNASIINRKPKVVKDNVATITIRLNLKTCPLVVKRQESVSRRLDNGYKVSTKEEAARLLFGRA